MQSVIIASSDPEEGERIAQDFIQKKKIGKFDVEVWEFEKDMGIPDVRRLKSKIFLRPLGAEKAVVIKLGEGITIEAQSAMLKLLEEPPASANLIIIAESEEIFLPTILSRCVVIKTENTRVRGENTNLGILKNPDLNEGFLIAQNISKDRKEAVGWLEDAITYLKEKAEIEAKKENSKETKKYSDKLKTLLETYNVAKNTNTNLRLTLENLFLSL